MVDHNRQQKIDNIRDQIDELKASLPAHSIPPAMLIELEDLEEELEGLLAESREEPDAAA
jgi:hypothetical protein